MFALLEHDTTVADAPPGARDTHWDLLIEVPGQERLPTWRLAQNPLTTASDIPAERIKDHRPLYLDYEGEIESGRGRVRRLDRGSANVERLAGHVVLMLLDGGVLRGRFKIAPALGGRLAFRRVQHTPPRPPILDAV